MKDFEKIKKAVLKHCGGFENASDGDIISKWNSLSDDIQKKYLTEIVEERKAAYAANKRPEN
jgi:hypothetical protein